MIFLFVDSSIVSNWSRASIQDAMIEVVAVTGSLHLAQLKLGLSSCLKVAQGTNIEIKFTKQLPLQVDGEPWIQNPCTISLEPNGQYAMLKRREDQPKSDQVVEVLDWAERTNVISNKQKIGLLKEFSRRLELNQ